ncbi:glycoside hydrolase family 5 protein [Curvularia clavata]|uniref:Glycoside hydrolase family 5 protein n=1 Tax=Curvularia clavata TaxID=95742 RepID=A0A9Q9DQ03_CURCL|nr:glycoside hydrolase family 5 protein [Curvularia clavata]
MLERLEYLRNGTEILKQGRQRYPNQPFRLVGQAHEIIVLPPSYADMIRNDPRLHFGLSLDLMPKVPGMEPFGTLLHEKRTLQTVIKKQLTKYLNLVTEPLSKEATFAVDLLLGNDPEYAASAFASGFFMGIFPSILKPLVPWFSAGPRNTKQKLNQARAILEPILEKRNQEKAEAKKKGEPAPVYNDALEWLEKGSQGITIDAATYQMALSFVAIHTTSDLLTQALTRFAIDPSLVQELRKVIIHVLSVNGLKKLGFANLKLMDRLDSLRLLQSTITLLSMRRVAKEKVVLPNGFVIQKGQYVGINGDNMINPKVYLDPETYDPYRHYRMRKDPSQAMKAHLVSTHPDNLTFGYGIHSCPGRFFAANEIKIALCHLLLKYDWELGPGASLEPYTLVCEQVSFNPANKLRYRRRKEELDLDSLEDDRLAVLDAVKDANLKTLRIFISHTAQNNKNTGSVEMPDIEPQQVGTYDDTQLRVIDQLMVEAHDRGIKLVIALHDRYQLGCWGNDTYVSKYKLPAIDCATTPAAQNDVTFFYQDASPIFDFDNRLTHILQHQNELIPGAPQWKDLSDYIFSFNIQNEGQGHLRSNIAPAPGWWCDRSKKMRSIMGNSAILISTGKYYRKHSLMFCGGNEFPNSDIPENWDCDTLDLIDIHSYSGVSEWRNKAPIALQHAQDAKKLVLFEEFGATGSNKARIVSQHIDVFNELKVPWMVWQINKPGKGVADFEFWTNEDTYTVVKQGASKALKIAAAQAFPTLNI